MAYLQRINYRPNTDQLSDAEKNQLAKHFDAYGAELVINGDIIPWERIEEIEVVKAARTGDLSGWLVKWLVMGGDRYHVGIYYGMREAVLTNVSLPIAEYVVKTIAYYISQPVQYTGPDDLAPLTEI